MIKSSGKKGFTLVELLIVIVVIAILAAITLVSYNGIQRRAKNTAIISAASQSMTLLRSYIVLEGKYPLYGDSACLTDSSGCVQYGEGTAEMEGDAALTASLTSIGTLPRSVPNVSSEMSGIMFTENPSRSFNGVDSDSALIVYYLDGENQDCNMSRVAADWLDNETEDGVMPVNPEDGNYTVGDLDGTGNTVCFVSVPSA